MTEALKPKPFLKWVGGKSQLLPELLARIPKTWNRETDFYVEPFVGAGALFWDLLPTHAILNDANRELMNVWRTLQGPLGLPNLQRILQGLAKCYKRDPEKVYYAVRDVGFMKEFREWCDPDLAARTIFLNKCGFNGLFRVNAGGIFNVPWGHNPKANCHDVENLNACAGALRAGGQTIKLCSMDFAEVFPEPPSSGTLVYADSPYVPVSKTSNFTTYTADGFRYVDQLRLVQYAVWLRDCGCHVMLSQAADEILIDQYRRCGFKCDLVQARRSVNSKGGKRGPVGEYIIYGGK